MSLRDMVEELKRHLDLHKSNFQKFLLVFLFFFYLLVFHRTAKLSVSWEKRKYSRQTKNGRATVVGEDRDKGTSNQRQIIRGEEKGSR